MRSLLPLALLALLPACAPAYTAPTGDAAFRAAFSSAGVTWVSGGQACVARVPEYRPVCPRLGRAVDVAWNGGDAWAGVPGAGLAVTLDRAARSVPAGAVAALSSELIYRQDGSALSYEGLAAGQGAGGPSAAVTGGDGLDYVVLDGQLRRGGAVVEAEAQPYLYATARGAATAAVPTAAASTGDLYRLQGGQLERIDASGRVIARTPHGPGRVGVVGQDIVTVSAAGEIRRYTQTLAPLVP
ncbi:hypothetical protein [Deinococcus sp. Leaf326]|uniref:hypothetical protein n=1 Tax=Deinococcus sp. Leaf326 TaxID=1736338 RepID=UPI0006F4D62A|nr:hypothetical protein [Deinococcus sp. Leaf326]KQR27813.1 hypothetical protein ASF71_04195 [Deinococcus sp. Leaf326]